MEMDKRIPFLISFFCKQIFLLFVFIRKLFMFALIKNDDERMNHLALHIASPISHFMGCNDSMMSMSMIMR